MTWLSQIPGKPQLSTLSLMAFIHGDLKILAVCSLNKSRNKCVDSFGVLHGLDRFAQSITILHCASSSRGVTPNSPKTIFVHVDILNDKIYLQNLKYNFSTTS